MDVNEHERLSNFTLKTQILIKEQHFFVLFFIKYKFWFKLSFFPLNNNNNNLQCLFLEDVQ